MADMATILRFRPFDLGSMGRVLGRAVLGVFAYSTGKGAVLSEVECQLRGEKGRGVGHAGIEGERGRKKGGNRRDRREPALACA